MVNRFMARINFYEFFEKQFKLRYNDPLDFDYLESQK